jgi:hypothetical protein
MFSCLFRPHNGPDRLRPPSAELRSETDRNCPPWLDTLEGVN